MKSDDTFRQGNKLNNNLVTEKERLKEIRFLAHRASQKDVDRRELLQLLKLIKDFTQI